MTEANYNLYWQAFWKAVLPDFSFSAKLPDWKEDESAKLEWDENGVQNVPLQDDRFISRNVERLAKGLLHGSPLYIKSGSQHFGGYEMEWSGIQRRWSLTIHRFHHGGRIVNIIFTARWLDTALIHQAAQDLRFDPSDLGDEQLRRIWKRFWLASILMKGAENNKVDKDIATCEFEVKRSSKSFERDRAQIDISFRTAKEQSQFMSIWKGKEVDLPNALRQVDECDQVGFKYMARLAPGPKPHLEIFVAGQQRYEGLFLFNLILHVVTKKDFIQGDPRIRGKETLSNFEVGSRRLHPQEPTATLNKKQRFSLLS